MTARSSARRWTTKIRTPTIRAAKTKVPTTSNRRVGGDSSGSKRGIATWAVLEKGGPGHSSPGPLARLRQGIGPGGGHAGETSCWSVLPAPWISERAPSTCSGDHDLAALELLNV